MILTSYFANWRRFPSDLRLVSIARGIPTWFNRDIELCNYPCVRPSRQLLYDYKRGVISEEEYEVLYCKQLELLNVSQFVDDYDLCILLCYEKSGSFCHRNILRQYVNSIMGSVVMKELSSNGLL